MNIFRRQKLIKKGGIVTKFNNGLCHAGRCIPPIMPYRVNATVGMQKKERKQNLIFTLFNLCIKTNLSIYSEQKLC